MKYRVEIVYPEYDGGPGYGDEIEIEANSKEEAEKKAWEKYRFQRIYKIIVRPKDMDPQFKRMQELAGINKPNMIKE